jgi:hypothetical protein
MIMRRPSTIIQKALEYIGLVPRERGWAAAHTIDWLPLPTQTAIMVKGIPIKYCTI